MALDEDHIGCLCHVMEDNVEGEAFILSVLSREDFLIADDLAGDGAMIQVIDICQSVRNYLITCDEVDHGLLQLNDFLADGGDLDDVEILVSRSMVACSFGRFLVEVSVSIPLVESTTDDDGDANRLLLFRKLFLISASVGAIVWMCDSNPLTRPLQPRHEDMTLASARTTEGHRHGCRLAAVSSVSPAVMSWSIEPTGEIHNPQLLHGSELVRNEILHEDWNISHASQRPIVLLSSEVVVADTLTRELENGDKQFESIISFYPHWHEDGNSFYKTLPLVGNLEVSLLAPFRDGHIVAICRHYALGFDHTDLDDLDGQWFGERSRGYVSVYAIVIDICSRTEIDRVCLIEELESYLDRDIATGGELPIKVAIRGGTVAVGIWWKGVIMTGAEVRLTREVSEGTENAHSSAKAKKKKRKTPKKGSKKDGFARGMSLRG
jgi:hypothetical protein